MSFVIIKNKTKNSYNEKILQNFFNFFNFNFFYKFKKLKKNLNFSKKYTHKNIKIK